MEQSRLSGDSDLRGERFLVTGSEGCIGSWVVRTLVQAGADVVATDLTPDGRRLRRILDPELCERPVRLACDIAEPGAVARLVAEHGITRIVHLAALQIPFVFADPLRGAEVNVLGTARVLEAARQSQGLVRGLSYASSGAVFGTGDDETRADSLYGVFKRCNEESARFYAADYETPSVGLRPCVVYGVNRDQGLTSAITSALKAAMLGLPYTVPFGGPIDLQYAEDVARCFIYAALVPNDTAHVFDLHGDLVEVADILPAIERQVPGAAGLLSWADAPLPGRVDFDDAPLRGFLGAMHKTPLEQGIGDTLAMLRRQADAGVLTPADLASGATGVGQAVS